MYAQEAIRDWYIVHTCSCVSRFGTATESFFVGVHRLAIRDWYIDGNLTFLRGSFLLVSAGFLFPFFRICDRIESNSSLSHSLKACHPERANGESKDL